MAAVAELCVECKVQRREAREAGSAELSKFCSAACAERWCSMCPACRQQPRVQKHRGFCSADCREESRKRKATAAALRQTCATWVTTGACPHGQGCWYRHPETAAAGELDCDSVLQVEAVYVDRVVDYLSEQYSVRVCRSERCPQRDSRKPGAGQWLLYAAGAQQHATELLSDPTLSATGALSRLYAVQQRAMTPAEVVRSAFDAAPPPPSLWRVQAFPRELEKVLVQGLAEASPRGFESFSSASATDVLSAVETQAGTMWGWSGRHPSAASGKRAVCRAEHKLKEVMSRVRWLREMLRGGEWQAVDIGSSPGGWTRVLADTEGCVGVTAIDPAAMDLPLPANVRHLRVRAEEAVPDLAQSDVRYTVVTCDMNTSPRIAAEAVSALGPALAPHAAVIVTWKNFVGTTAEMQQCTDEAVALLRVRLNLDPESVQSMHLMANGVAERTFVGRVAAR
eukprot:TRINITY_DN20204_c0_g1_i1.p1 TRINITY_DN20204_c0_g1~~TRINITY_DN20204_c0_g1_i1.p1  ORF type:complete len:454 (+),score=125.84 TRINITY_DN20204_c0_g1_i1:63-1424(+)